MNLLIFQCYSGNVEAGKEGTRYAGQGEMEFGEPVSLSLTACETDRIVIHL